MTARTRLSWNANSAIHNSTHFYPFHPTFHRATNKCAHWTMNNTSHCPNHRATAKVNGKKRAVLDYCFSQCSIHFIAGCSFLVFRFIYIYIFFLLALLLLLLFLRYYYHCCCYSNIVQAMKGKESRFWCLCQLWRLTSLIPYNKVTGTRIITNHRLFIAQKGILTYICTDTSWTWSSS